MPRRVDRTAADISKTDFAYQQRLHSFAYLPNIDRFIDLRHPRANRHIVALRDHSGSLLRQASIDSCLAARAAYEAHLAEQERAEQSKADLAEKLAPSALPACRADLEGPAAVNQLADDFIVQTTRQDGVVWADLVRLGWTGPQLKQHGDAARIVAQRRQHREIAEDTFADVQLRAVAVAMAEPAHVR